MEGLFQVFFFPVLAKVLFCFFFVFYHPGSRLGDGPRLVGARTARVRGVVQIIDLGVEFLSQGSMVLWEALGRIGRVLVAFLCDFLGYMSGVHFYYLAKRGEVVREVVVDMAAYGLKVLKFGPVRWGGTADVDQRYFFGEWDWVSAFLIYARLYQRQFFWRFYFSWLGGRDELHSCGPKGHVGRLLGPDQSSPRFFVGLSILVKEV